MHSEQRRTHLLSCHISQQGEIRRDKERKLDILRMEEPLGRSHALMWRKNSCERVLCTHHILLAIGIFFLSSSITLLEPDLDLLSFFFLVSDCCDTITTRPSPLDSARRLAERAMSSLEGSCLGLYVEDTRSNDAVSFFCTRSKS